MRKRKWLVVSLGLLLLVGGRASAFTLLIEGHVDGIGVGYAAGAWDLHVHDDETDLEYDPADVVFLVPPAVQTVIPAAPSPYSFLGTAGAPVWILPQTQVPGVLFLGSSAHEVENGVFAGDIKISLVGVSGPGNFFLYQTDMFGLPIQFMNSANGIDSADKFEIPAGGHIHFNWAFTAEGMHTVTVQASAVLAGSGELTQSEPTAYRFWVGDPALIPEPTTGLLVGLGMLAAGAVMRRKK